ncbi:hypothetical protein [Hydrocarboniphaga sp.]|uniref:hypothetical protein n=1 Tax=Hydrocarboniphaga sp. TaxID=2033016 RepID=UPI003D12F7F0
MNHPASPFETAPPSARRLLASIAIAVAVAALVLLLFVLPAQYGVDATGLGKKMGLTAMSNPSRPLVMQDVIGGNDHYRQAPVAASDQPLPLPNPAVSQIKPEPPQTRTMQIKLPVGGETEIKAVLDAAQVILFSWKSDADIYTDYHGHEPDAGDSFVRYEEQMSGHAGNGSLVAPFSGEHGWYWVNISDRDVTIELTVTGYYKEIKDYGRIR